MIIFEQHFMIFDVVQLLGYKRFLLNMVPGFMPTFVVVLFGVMP